MKIEFEEPGTFPRPGPIGRACRLAAGASLLYFFALILAGSRHSSIWRRDWTPLQIAWCVLAAAALYLLPGLVDISFRRSWGRPLQLLLLFLAAAISVFDLIRFGSIWAPPLAVLTFLATSFFLGWVGMSFLLAGLFAVPGCELRAASCVLGQMRGLKVAEHY